MFNILEIALKILSTNDAVYFTKEDLVRLTGLCDQSVSNNITRLIEAGFLERVEYRLPDRRGRFCKYCLKNGDINEFMDLYFR